MYTQILKDWVRLLRGDWYYQLHGSWYAWDDQRAVCAVGVLLDAYIVNWQEIDDKIGVAARLLECDKEFIQTIVEMNDDGVKFVHIADYLEKSAT